MKTLRIVGLALLVAAIVIGIWRWIDFSREAERRVPGTVQPATPEPKPAKPELVITPDPEQVELEAFRKEIRALALEKKWAELDARAEELRKSKARFPGGSWKIRHFYESVNPYENVRPWVQLSRLWIAERPQSITAHIAYTEALLDYAWAARGETAVNELSPEVAKLFKDQLDEAWEVLEKAKELPEKDPYWWSSALRAGQGLGFERKRYDQLFDEAVAFEPGFFPYYLQKARYLLPRWHGKPGEWEEFAEAVAKKPDGPGAEVYARIIMDMARDHRDVFGETAVSWELARAGFEEILQKYPESLYWPSVYGFFACRNKDRDAARKVFEKLDGRVLLSAWGKQEMFVECRDWALSKDVSSTTPEPSAPGVRQ